MTELRTEQPFSHSISTGRYLRKGDLYSIRDFAIAAFGAVATQRQT